MKKVLSLILCAVMLASALAGCTTLEKTETGDYDKGAIIDMYFTTEVYDLDPQRSIIDDAQLKIMSQIYEGLTRLDENGKWKKAGMKSYKIDKDEDGEFVILVALNYNRWSDGRTVQASDYVYAWKRILDQGKAVMTEEAARVLVEKGVYLYGNESQTVGPENRRPGRGRCRHLHPGDPVRAEG